MKKYYRTPCILQRVTVQLESGFLQGSVVTPNTTIETAGQTVEKHDFDGTITNSGYNHTWGL